MTIREQFKARLERTYARILYHAAGERLNPHDLDGVWTLNIHNGALVGIDFEASNTQPHYDTGGVVSDILIIPHSLKDAAMELVTKASKRDPKPTPTAPDLDPDGGNDTATDYPAVG